MVQEQAKELTLPFASCKELMWQNELVLFVPRSVEEALYFSSYWFFEDAPFTLYTAQQANDTIQLKRAALKPITQTNVRLIDQDERYFTQLFAQAFSEN